MHISCISPRLEPILDELMLVVAVLLGHLLSRMEAGRRTQTLTFSSSSTEASPLSHRASSSRFRILEKRQLGGVIFGCTRKTIEECLHNRLFGLPAPHFAYVQNINPGLPLFLFNYNGRKLHGIFEALSPGQLNIDQQAWTTDGSQRTAYPAQVKVHMRLQCQALHEDQFKPVIQDNYYSANHFWFELDRAQTSKLMSLLSSHGIAPSASTPKLTEARRIRPSDTQHRSKSEGLAFKHDRTDSPLIVEEGANLEQEGFLEKQTVSGCPLGIAQLMKEMEDLKAFNTDQHQKMEYLEQKLVKAETEIQCLKDRCMILESESIGKYGENKDKERGNYNRK